MVIAGLTIHQRSQVIWLNMVEAAVVLPMARLVLTPNKAVEVFTEQGEEEAAVVKMNRMVAQAVHGESTTTQPKEVPLVPLAQEVQVVQAVLEMIMPSVLATVEAEAEEQRHLTLAALEA